MSGDVVNGGLGSLEAVDQSLIVQLVGVRGGWMGQIGQGWQGEKKMQYTCLVFFEEMEANLYKLVDEVLGQQLVLPAVQQIKELALPGAK